LSDASPDVRAAGAWALGRSGREEAAAYLAPRLHDDWIVAAQAARALRALGAAGRRALEAAAAVEDGELARQMLWETHARAGA
jgi:HEAT repeat protein